MPKPIAPINAALLYRQMAAAHRNKISMVDLFSILVEDPQLLGNDAPVAAQILNALQQGGGLSQALSRLPDLYPAPTVALIESAQECEQLSEVLDTLAEEQSQLVQGGSAIRSALLWPSTVFFLGLTVLTVILIFVVPAFRDVYGSFGAELPAPTLLLIYLSDLVVGYWWVVVAFVAAFLFGRKRQLIPASWRLLPERFAMALPFVRDYVTRSMGTQLLRWLVQCHKHHALLQPALKHVICTCKWQVLQSMLTELSVRLTAGQSPGQALDHLAPMARRLGMQVRLGERLGEGGNALEQALETAEFELSHSLLRYERGTFLVGYLAMGLFVGFVVISLYLPIFKLGTIA